MIIIYLLVTLFIIYFLQTEQIFKKLVQAVNWSFLSELWYCPKCLGFWVSIFTGILFNIDYFSGILEHNIITEIITAAITSYLLYYLRVGIEITHVNITIK